MREDWFFLKANGTEAGTTLYVAVQRQSDEVNFSVENDYCGDTVSGTGALASISLTRQEAQRLVDELGKELARVTDNITWSGATLALFGLGLAGLGFSRRKRV